MLKLAVPAAITFALICVFMANNAWSQAQIPPCPSSPSSEKWNGCIGTLRFADGSKYVGEFKNGKRNGRGTYSSLSGERYEGDWKDDRRNGFGYEWAANGSITKVGRWADGMYVGSTPLVPIVATHTVPPYPPDAVSANAQGLSLVEVSINTSGSVDKCTIVSSAGFELLDTVACDWVSRNWRWSPPTQAGSPIASKTRVSINWKLSAAALNVTLHPIMSTHTLAPYPPISVRLNEQGVSLVEVTIDTEGSVSECSIVRSSGYARLDAAACGWIKANWRWEPPTLNGVPTRVRTRIQETWNLKDPPPPACEDALGCAIIKMVADAVSIPLEIPRAILRSAAPK